MWWKYFEAHIVIPLIYKWKSNYCEVRTQEFRSGALGKRSGLWRSLASLGRDKFCNERIWGILFRWGGIGVRRGRQRAGLFYGRNQELGGESPVLAVVFAPAAVLGQDGFCAVKPEAVESVFVGGEEGTFFALLFPGGI